MSEFNRHDVYVEEKGESLGDYYARVFSIMGLGLVITSIVAYMGYYSLVSGGFVYNLLVGSSSMFVMLGLFIAELGIAIALGRGLMNYSTATCRTLFFVYCVLSGVTFSVIPAAYGFGTVFVAFIFAAVLFVSCGIIGKTTSVDLSQFRGLLYGALLAVIIMSILSIFIPILRNNLLIGYFGLIVFLGLTAYDMQKIKAYYYQADGELKDNLAVYSAFQLYLDFINILLYIIRILGNRNRN